MQNFLIKQLTRLYHDVDCHLANICTGMQTKSCPFALSTRHQLGTILTKPLSSNLVSLRQSTLHISLITCSYPYLLWHLYLYKEISYSKMKLLLNSNLKVLCCRYQQCTYNLKSKLVLKLYLQAYIESQKCWAEQSYGA